MTAALHFTDHVFVCSTCRRLVRVSQETIDSAREGLDVGNLTDAQIATTLDFCIRCADGSSDPAEAAPALAWTREAVEALKVGDLLAHTIDSRQGKTSEDSRWTMPRTVEEIYARGLTPKGTAYVCFYTTFGPGSRISGSLVEGDEVYRSMPGLPE